MPANPTSPRPDRAAPEHDFTGGAIHALSVHVGSTGDREIDARIRALVDDWSADPATSALVQEMIVTAMKLGRDQLGAGELKLMNRALKEMRAANRVFQPYRNSMKVTVYGSARTTPDQPAFAAALAFSRRMREEGWMTITGAGDGIMGAAQQGAGRDDSFGLNINLPFEQGANETIVGDAKLLTFNYFFTRKLTFVKEANAFALFPGGFGTMDEGFELLTLMQTGKVSIMPILLVDEPGGTYWKTWRHFVDIQLMAQKLISPSDFSLFHITDSVEDAASHILAFYRKFHSYRFVGGTMVVRLNGPLGAGTLDRLNRDFRDILERGEFKVGGALPEEANEPEIAHLPRLLCRVRRRDWGRIRQMIDTLNADDGSGAATASAAESRP